MLRPKPDGRISSFVRLPWARKLIVIFNSVGNVRVAENYGAFATFRFIITKTLTTYCISYETHVSYLSADFVRYVFFRSDN
jgi:hypothetical protein